MLVALKQFYLSKSFTSSITKIIIASILIAISAQFKVYLGIVPFTLQTLAIFVIAYTLGTKLALGTILSYIAYGICGLNVFASGVGMSAITGPNGGFIIGFIAMSYFAGLTKDKGCNSLVSLSLYSLLATTSLYICGLAQLSLFVPSEKLLEVGLYPFILTDLAKAILAVCLINPAYKFFKKF